LRLIFTFATFFSFNPTTIPLVFSIPTILSGSYCL
jgi:hypothetical protein